LKKTLREITAHAGTLEGAHEKVLIDGYGPPGHISKELDRLCKEETRLASEMFQDYLDLLGGNVKMAEREMVARFMLPPHWRDEKLCELCGPVMVESAERDCPWCEVMTNALMEIGSI
jgi:hypothetical protein